jgi:hypothetical protein
LLAARGKVLPEELRSRRSGAPDFICFYIGFDMDWDSQRMVTDSLEAMRDFGQDMKPRPGIVVYARDLQESKKLHLISLGAIVLTGRIAGLTPEGVDGFRNLLDFWLSEVLRGGDWDQRETVAIPGTRHTISDSSSSSRAAPNVKEINGRYKSMLDQLVSTLPQLSMS